MTIRLRPHHLLCMLTFAGEGYSPEFVTNFERIARLIGAGDQTVEIVFAPDDICGALLDDVRGHCRETSVSERDRIAAEALTGLLGQAVVENAKIELTEGILKRMRGAFAAGMIRQACHGCQWSPLCDRIASHGFSNTSLHCASRR